MTDTTRPPYKMSRTLRLCLVAVGVVAGLAIFAYARKIGPFEVRKGSPEVIAVLDGGYKGQQPFHTALQHVRAHPAVTAALGEPVSDDGLERYQKMFLSAGERYDYVIRLKGPQGEGTAAVSVEDLAQRYRVTSASFTDGAGKSHDLLASE